MNIVRTSGELDHILVQHLSIYKTYSIPLQTNTAMFVVTINMVENCLKILFLCTVLAEARVAHKITSKHEHALFLKELPLLSHQPPLPSGGHLPTLPPPLSGQSPFSLHSPSNGRPLLPLAFRGSPPPPKTTDEMSISHEPRLSPSLSDQPLPNSRRLPKSTSTNGGPCDKSRTDCNGTTSSTSGKPCPPLPLTPCNEHDDGPHHGTIS